MEPFMNGSWGVAADKYARFNFSTVMGPFEFHSEQACIGLQSSAY